MFDFFFELRELRFFAGQVKDAPIVVASVHLQIAGVETGLPC
jgi:hypothetical protein